MSEHLQQNGWKRIPKARGHAGMYSKYANQIAVIVPRGEKIERIALTDAGVEALDNPEYVDLFLRGTNVAIMASDDSGYKLSNTPGKVNSTLYYIISKGLMQMVEQECHIVLRPGVYIAHIESGMIVFDCSQTPAAL